MKELEQSSTNSVTIRIQGGLGNQLFGWATAYALSSRINSELLIDKTLLKRGQYELDNYNLPSHSILDQKISKKWIDKIRHNPLHFKESSFTYDTSILNCKKGTILDGYFQSWKYFDDYKGNIAKILSANREFSEEFVNLFNYISQEETIAIHIRRGDYIDLTQYHGLTSAAYFEKAFLNAKSLTSATRAVVFSDSKSIAEQVFPNADKYIGPEDLKSSSETLDLMSRCSGIIGSNSSFSWWAAYIRDSESRPCIFPRPWFTETSLDTRDLLMPHWLTLGNS